jgi:hypothetical protein
LKNTYINPISIVKELLGEIPKGILIKVRHYSSSITIFRVSISLDNIIMQIRDIDECKFMVRMYEGRDIMEREIEKFSLDLKDPEIDKKLERIKKHWERYK